MDRQRRYFLRQLAAGGTAAAVEIGSLLARAIGTRVGRTPVRRRIIYNDDGDAAFPRRNPRAAEGPEGFLSTRFNPRCRVPGGQLLVVCG